MIDMYTAKGYIDQEHKNKLKFDADLIVSKIIELEVMYGFVVHQNMHGRLTVLNHS